MVVARQVEIATMFDKSRYNRQVVPNGIKAGFRNKKTSRGNSQIIKSKKIRILDERLAELVCKLRACGQITLAKKNIGRSSNKKSSLINKPPKPKIRAVPPINSQEKSSSSTAKIIV